MGKGGELSGGTSRRIGGIGDLPLYHTPNSRIDLYNQSNQLIQQRWYGPRGRARRNRDFRHGGGRHTFPHDHRWDWR